MHDKTTPSSTGAGTHDHRICLHCDAQPEPDGTLLAERHADHCPVFDRSRRRRDHDVAELAARPPGWTLVRRVDPSEVDDLTDAVGRVVRSRRELRRWQVRVTAQQAGTSVHVGRVFLRDGEPCAALIDSCAVGGQR